jgi:myosin heavy subunit
MASEDKVLGARGVEDMITLDNLTEETMLRNLQIRYNNNLIYVC